jgi:hypothetical protein
MDYIFAVAILVMLISVIGVLFGRGGKLTPLASVMQNPSRVQSVSILGIGLSALTLAFTELGGASSLGFLVFLVCGIASTMAGVVALTKKAIETGISSPTDSLSTEATTGKSGSVIRTILWSMAGFGIGLAIAGEVNFELYKVLKKQIPNIYLLFGSQSQILYVLAGSTGGAALGFAKEPKNKIVFWALAGFIGCGVGGLALFLVYKYEVLDPVIRFAYSTFGADGGRILFRVIDNIVIGIFAGAAFGIVQRNWKQSICLAMAGAIGFGLYRLWDYYWISEKVTLLLYIHSVAVINGFIELIGGAIIGLCFGLAIEWQTIFVKKQPAMSNGNEG